MQYLIWGKCIKGQKCKKVHIFPKDDHVYRMSFDKGTCTRGDKCLYKHSGGDGVELVAASRTSVHQNDSPSIAKNVTELLMKGNAQIKEEDPSPSGLENNNITSLEDRKLALLENQSVSQNHKGL